MTETIKRIKLEGTDRKNEESDERLNLASAMLEAGDREIFLETDELPFAPKAIVALNRDGETLGYLPAEIVGQIYDDVLMTEEDDEEEARATLISVNDDEIEVEIDIDTLPEYEDKPPSNKEDAKPQKKKKNPAGFALIAIISFYLAYRMFTRGG